MSRVGGALNYGIGDKPTGDQQSPEELKIGLMWMEQQLV